MLKIFFMFSLLLASSSAFCSDNISVVIDGQSYVCSGSGSTVGDPCAGSIAGLKAAVDSCANGSSNSYPGCIGRIWPSFKSANLSCSFQAISVCIDYCANGSSNSYPGCSDFCSN